MPYWRDGSLEKYTPSGDYVVVKFARWAFEKFPQAKDHLGTQMKAVGEVMSIGKDFKEAFQKAIRSLEIAAPARLRRQDRETHARRNSARWWQIPPANASSTSMRHSRRG